MLVKDNHPRIHIWHNKFLLQDHNKCNGLSVALPHDLCAIVCQNSTGYLFIWWALVDVREQMTCKCRCIVCLFLPGWVNWQQGWIYVKPKVDRSIQSESYPLSFVGDSVIVWVSNWTHNVWLCSYYSPPQGFQNSLCLHPTIKTTENLVICKTNNTSLIYYCSLIDQWIASYYSVIPVGGGALDLLQYRQPKGVLNFFFFSFPSLLAN